MVSHRGAFSPVAFEYFLEPSDPATNLPDIGTRYVPSKVVREHLRLLIKTIMDELEERDHGSSRLVLDFGFLKSVLGKGGIVARFLKCPSCGADLTIPGDGATITCDYCGSSVQALDMFERIRAILDTVDTDRTNEPE